MSVICRFDVNIAEQFVNHADWHGLEMYFTQLMGDSDKTHPYLWFLCRRSVLLRLKQVDMDQAVQYFDNRIKTLKGVKNEFTNTQYLDKTIDEILDCVQGKR